MEGEQRIEEKASRHNMSCEDLDAGKTVGDKDFKEIEVFPSLSHEELLLSGMKENIYKDFINIENENSEIEMEVIEDPWKWTSLEEAVVGNSARESNFIEHEFGVNDMKNFHPKAEAHMMECKIERLDDHIQLVNKLDISSCELCGKEFQTRNDWQIHVLKDHRRDPSEYLGGGTKSSSSVDQPSNSGNVMETTCICLECGKVFESRPKLKAHVKKVHIYGHFLCPECGKEFKVKQHLKNHLFNHHQIGGQCEYCPECGKMFEFNRKLKAHIKNVHTFGQFKCPECGKEFVLKQQLKNRRSNHHQALKQCPHCYKDVKYLAGHINAMHPPKTEEPIICEVCSKIFRSKKYLRGHTLAVHSEADRAVMCHVCARTFKNPYYCKQHLRRVHGNSATCDECGKKYANPAYLQHHMKWSHELELSVCAVCSGQYKNRRSLQRHMRYAHTVQVKMEHAPPSLSEEDLKSISTRSNATSVIQENTAVFTNLTHLGREENQREDSEVVINQFPV